jgi:hypothetical protein
MLNMKVENPNAYQFFMQDEIYLLEKDKGIKSSPEVPDAIFTTLPETKPPVAETPVLAEPNTANAPAAPEPVLETPKASFNYLGNNNKNFLILVNYPTDEFIAPHHLTALENILKRKEMAISDVAIVNTNHTPGVTFEQLNTYFKSAKLLILGEQALPAGIGKVTLNHPFTLNNCTALYSYSFGEMMDINDHKKAFWEQMKKL